MEPKTEPFGEITWEALRPISKEAIAFAAQTTNKILERVGSRGVVYVAKTITVFLGEGLHFGFPPKEFLDSLTPLERKRLEADNISRDGWLSNKCPSGGVLVSKEEKEDYLIRIFLSLLRGKAKRMYITDEHDLLIGSRFRFPSRPDQFDWCGGRDALEASIRRHLLMEGEEQMMISAPPEGFEVIW